MFTKKLICILYILNISVYSISFELIKGESVTQENREELLQSSRPYNIAGYIHEQNSDVVKSFFELDNKVYSVSSKAHLGISDIQNVISLKYWSLSRWRHEYIHPEIIEKALGIWGGRPYEPELTFRLNTDSGCLADTPLRYGDIDNNGSNEIVLFTQEDLLFFSPEAEKTIFMVRFHADDWLTPEESTEFYSWIKGGTREGLNLPQFQSEFYATAGNSVASIDTGLRGIAKLYIQDFDQNKQMDIVVWHKLFESNMADQIPGFTLLTNKYLHYAWSTEQNEYLPQKTEEPQIQAWLSENNHTWQTGFPSKSECVGQEGILIPEMHDPLLNDPEVLR